jgi:hypothetical protein
MCVREYGQKRKERMYILEELGHGPDDRDSVSFVRSMQEKFEMGVIRNNAGALNRMRCDLTSVSSFQKEEYGS